MGRNLQHDTQTYLDLLFKLRKVSRVNAGTIVEQERDGGRYLRVVAGQLQKEKIKDYFKTEMQSNCKGCCRDLPCDLLQTYCEWEKDRFVAWFGQGRCCMMSSVVHL